MTETHDHAERPDQALEQGPLYEDPFEWFESWFERATTQAAEAHACVVATVNELGRPSTRVVYLKEWDRRGFVFYTNLESQKGEEALKRGEAAMNFFWRELREQIRIEGLIERVSEVQADVYFASRSRASQLGAWASQQSRPLSSRQELLERLAELERRYEGEDVPRPPHWSGLRLVPRRLEFWRAGAHRLHDRFTFTRDLAETPQGDTWQIERLNP